MEKKKYIYIKRVNSNPLAVSLGCKSGQGAEEDKEPPLVDSWMRSTSQLSADFTTGPRPRGCAASLLPRAWHPAVGQPLKDKIQTVCSPGSCPPCTHALSQNWPPRVFQTIFSLVTLGLLSSLPRKEDNQHNGTLVLSVIPETRLPELPASPASPPWLPVPMMSCFRPSPVCVLCPPKQRQHETGEITWAPVGRTWAPHSLGMLEQG